MDNGQRKRLFGALAAIGQKSKEQRAELIRAFTNGRTDSTRELSSYEADELIKKLESKDYQSADRQRKKIISMAYEMRWGNPNTPEGRDETVRRIDNWCISKTAYRKHFNSLTLQELPHVVTQFREVYKKHLKAI